jgi:hypothetical protein
MSFEAAGIGAMWIGAMWLAPPGNRSATISAGESANVWTGSALKPVTKPAMPPTPITAKQANARLLARCDRHPIPDTPIELPMDYIHRKRSLIVTCP